MFRRCVSLFVLFFLILTPGVSALTVVSTTTVTWDPLRYIGGDKVEAIYIADPTICPHMQSDIIPNRIQMQKDFIRDADLFVAINGSVDKEYVMPFVNDFMKANDYGPVSWVTLKNPAMTWNTPANAKALATEAGGWLIAADPANRTYYESRLSDYLAQIDAVDLTAEEKSQIAGQDVVVMVWQKDAAENWLGLHVTSIFAPEFYQSGKFTPVKIVDNIQANPGLYKNVSYVIENMQSGELAKGIHEAVNNEGVPAKRVIFTNFPKSLPGVDTLPDVLEYNKNSVKPQAAANASPAAERASVPAPTKSPMSLAPVLVALCLFMVAVRYRK
jgi:zinc/manganese transport system substrate-binding protein